MSGLASRLHVQLRSHAPNKFCRAAFRGKHPGEKKQIASLHRLCINAEWLRRYGERDAKFIQPLLGTGRT